MNKKFVVRLSVEERGQLESLVTKGKAAARKLTRARILLKADCSSLGPAWSDEQNRHALDLGVIMSTGSAAHSSKVVLRVPSFVVPDRAVRECATASRRPTSSPWHAEARQRVGAAGRSVSWRTDWSNPAMSTRSPMKPSVERSKKRVEAVAGTFSPTVPGPVDSADTFNGQGGPRSRSKPLQEKEFRATYCLSVHC